MEGSFIDDLETMGVTEEFVNQIVDELNADDSEALAWYEENELPQGLQCVEVHMWPSTKEFLTGWCLERGVVLDAKHLVWAELIMDNLIS